MGMNTYLLVAMLLLSTSSVLPGQAITHQPSFVEFETGMREELIYLDTLVIKQVVSVLSSEGCTNLNYFLGPFETASSYLHYPIGFKFAKFPGGFGDKLKKEICKAIAEKDMCIDQIIENVFVGGDCYRDEMRISCHPVSRLIFNDKDTVVITRIKDRIATNGYRIKYNSNTVVFPFIKQAIDREWIRLFNDKELDLMDKEQLAYLRGLGYEQH